MEWKFFLHKDQFRLTIKFFNLPRDSFLKAKTQRIKLQLMILLRTLNQQLSAEEEFIVNPANNLLEYHFRMSWQQYKLKIPKIQSLKRFLLYILSKIRQFSQVIYFCEPTNNLSQKQMESQRIHLFDDTLKTLNNFRLILRNTKNIRILNKDYHQKLKELKSFLPQSEIQSQLIQHETRYISLLYQQNINLLYQQSLGLQKCQQSQKIHEKCLSNILYHQNPKDKNNQQPGHDLYSNDSQNKIVYGIDVIRMDREKILSKQGAHSHITRGLVLYKLVKSIDTQTVKYQTTQWLHGNQRKTQLTLKRCNYATEASKNSFMNQLYFLNYIRDYHSSFIGKYYLEMKTFRQRNQKDPIYMKSYYQNVDYIVRKCLTLSIKDRLNLIYRISLGLCFLMSKNILHRDFKPHNIVVNPSLTPHIIDFGSCCPSLGFSSFVPFDKRLLTSKHIHIYYHQLPQQYHYIYQKLTKQQYQQHPLFDIYSLGKVMTFIMFGKFQTPHYQEIQNTVYKQLLQNLIFLIQICQSVDPDDRPGIGEVTGFLGTLSKYYTQYVQYFMTKTMENTEKRYHSQPKPSI